MSKLQGKAGRFAYLWYPNPKTQVENWAELSSKNSLKNFIAFQRRKVLK